MSNSIYRAVFSSVPGSELMFGRYVLTDKKKDETHEQHELRTWQEKIHNADGHCFIQPFALKNALESAGKWLSMKIPGEGKKTFTDRFRKGVLVVDRMMLGAKDGSPIKVKQVESRSLFVPSDGKRGGSRRVFRIFPTISEWSTEILIHVMDGKIDESVLRDHLECVGSFVGFGSMRVENGGINGRFSVDSLEVVSS